MLTKIHINNETELNFNYNTKLKSFFVQINVVRNYYSKAKIFYINNEQKIRC